MFINTNNGIQNTNNHGNGSIMVVTKLITSIVICQLAGFIGAIFTMPAIQGWYQTLKKPFFVPPDWIFSFVWIVLFLLMGVSLFFVWLKGADGESKVIFGTQLILNILWTAFFFGLKSPGLAFIEIVFLWFVILCTIISFYRISRLAGLLLLPYIIWVTFAGVLNYFIWILN